MNVLYIIGQAGDQSSNRVPVEKREGEHLKMGEEFHPKVMHHLLPRDFHEINLDVINSKMGHQDENNEEGNSENSLDIPPPQSEKILPSHLVHPVEGENPVTPTLFKKGRVFLQDLLIVWSPFAFSFSTGRDRGRLVPPVSSRAPDGRACPRRRARRERRASPGRQAAPCCR